MSASSAQLMAAFAGAPLSVLTTCSSPRVIRTRRPCAPSFLCPLSAPLPWRLARLPAILSTRTQSSTTMSTPSPPPTVPVAAVGEGPLPMGASFGRAAILPRRTSVGLYELERLGVEPARLLGSTASPAAADGPPGNEGPFAAAVGAMVAATLIPPLFGTSAEAPVALAVGGGLVAWAVDALAFKSAGSNALAGLSVDAARVVAHEAGHFLVAYLLGVRVERVAMTAESAKAAGMPAIGVDVALGVRTDLWTLSAVACAGMAGEWASYGGAEGGRQDLVDLGGHLRRAGIRGGEGGEVKGYTRWGLLQAVTLLDQQRGAFEELCNTLAAGADVAECIAAVERRVDCAALEGKAPAAG